MSFMWVRFERQSAVVLLAGRWWGWGVQKREAEDDWATIQLTSLSSITITFWWYAENKLYFAFQWSAYVSDLLLLRLLLFPPSHLPVEPSSSSSTSGALLLALGRRWVVQKECTGGWATEREREVCWCSRSFSGMNWEHCFHPRNSNNSTINRNYDFGECRWFGNFARCDLSSLLQQQKRGEGKLFRDVGKYCWPSLDYVEII